MEGLVLIIFGLLQALLAPVLALVCAVFLGVLEAIGYLVSGLTGTSEGGADPAAESRNGIRLTGRRWMRFLAVPTVLVVLIVLVLNQFFFPQLVRWAFDEIAHKTGYQVSFAQVEGDLLQGKLALQDAQVKRQTGEGISLDISVNRFVIDVDVFSLFASEIDLTALEVRGVKGRLGLPEPTQQDVDLPERRNKRRFNALDANFSDISLTVERANRRTFSFDIVSADVAPLRSRNALFHLLFRSNLEARIDGAPLRVHTEPISSNGRRTQWTLEDVPLTTIAALADRPPLAWLNGGTVSAQIFDEWDLNELNVEMDWKITLSGVQFEPHAIAGVRGRLLAKALDQALARKGDPAFFAFRLALDGDSFDFRGRDSLASLWETLIAVVLGKKFANAVNGGPTEATTLARQG